MSMDPSAKFTAMPVLGNIRGRWMDTVFCYIVSLGDLKNRGFFFLLYQQGLHQDAYYDQSYG